jgi:hypothetical protein
MNQAVLAVVIVVVLLAIGLSVSLLSQRKLAQFEQACRERGWQVERGGGRAFDQRISGTTGGINWQYEFYSYQSGTTSSASRSSTRFGRWHTDAASLPGQVVLIIPSSGRAGQLDQTIQAMDKLGGLGRTLIEMFVTKGLKGDPSDVDLFMRLQHVQAGSEALRQKFTVLATGEDAAAKLLSQGEAALIEYVMNPTLKGVQRQVSVLLWGHGLTLPVERLITDINVMDAMVNLGAALANSAKGW